MPDPNPREFLSRFGTGDQVEFLTYDEPPILHCRVSLAYLVIPAHQYRLQIVPAWVAAPISNRKTKGEYRWHRIAQGPEEIPAPILDDLVILSRADDQLDAWDIESNAILRFISCHHANFIPPCRIRDLCPLQVH